MPVTPKNPWVHNGRSPKNKDLKKNIFSGVFGVSFVYIANLFAVGSLINLAAFLIGLGIGNSTFKILENKIEGIRLRNLSMLITGCVLSSIGLLSYVLSQQMKQVPTQFEKTFEETANTYEKHLANNNDSVFTDEAALVQSLLKACKDGSVADGNLILQQGVKINDKLAGMTCLYAASQFGQVAIIDWALDVGAKIDDINGPMQITALHIAAQEGQIDSIKLLLQRGANPNVQNHHGRTPEYFARGLPVEKYNEIKALLQSDKIFEGTKYPAEFTDNVAINARKSSKDASPHCQDVDFDGYKNTGTMTDEQLDNIVNCPNEFDEWLKNNPLSAQADK